MATPDVLLFDFFGTLVTYEADRTAIRYERTHRLLTELGSTLGHDDFVVEWDRASSEVEARGAESLVENTMDDAAMAFALRIGLDLDLATRRALIELFLDEWAEPVRPVPGADALIRSLAGSHRLGVVSNTHDPSMVPRLLDAMGVADAFDDVLLSVDHGFRKPHPSIYEAALDRFGCAPADALFVGDSLDADYLGPIEAGMGALLIDPDRHHDDVAAADRLDSVLDLGGRLHEHSGAPRRDSSR